MILSFDSYQYFGMTTILRKLKLFSFSHSQVKFITQYSYLICLSMSLFIEVYLSFYYSLSNKNLCHPML